MTELTTSLLNKAIHNLKTVDLENEEINKELIKSLTAFNNSKLIQGVLDGYKLRNI